MPLSAQVENVTQVVIMLFHNMSSYCPSELFHTLNSNYHTFLGYAIRRQSYCSSTLDGIYSTKNEAEGSCDQMQQQYNNCTTISDTVCNPFQVTGIYKICKKGSLIKKSSKGSCTYFKQGYISSEYFLAIIYFKNLP